MKHNYPHIDLSPEPGSDPQNFFGKVEAPYSRSKEEVWAEMEAKLTETPSQLRTYRYPLMAAASLLLLAGISALLLFYTTRISSPAGQHLSHVLPDGSVIRLNAGSEITYKTFMWRFQRTINFEGEAYFEVQKGKKFAVISSNGKTEVLGTSFNIYSRNDEYKVTCITGSVKVVSPSNEEAVLTPEYEATVDQKGNILVSKEIKSGMSHAWINNMFYFVGRPLPLVLEEIARQYNINIRTDQAFEYTYTGYFSKDKAPEDVLELVCKPFGLTFVKISENQFEVRKN